MSPEKPAPQIAVVVGAYGREEYLPAAVSSVLRQTLDRSQYELVVTKDFRAPALDRQLEEAGARLLLDPDPRMGRVVRAARQTTAPLVAYLDDDDLFEPERLEHVLRLFRSRPGTTFYRNRVSVIDPAGRPVDPERWDRLYRDPEFDRTGPVAIGSSEKRERWPELNGTYAEFNLSSMVFRREVFEEPYGKFLEGVDARIDLGHFLAGYLSIGEAYFDDRRLTRYRLHPTNSSRIRVRPGQRLPKGWLAFEWLRADAAARGQPEIARWTESQRIAAGLGFAVDRLSAAIASGYDGLDADGCARDYLTFVRHHPEALTHAWAWKPLLRATTQLVRPSRPTRAGAPVPGVGVPTPRPRRDPKAQRSSDS